MRVRRRPGRRWPAAFASLLLALAATVAGPDAPQAPYTRSVGDDGRLFVMLPPGSAPWTRGDGQAYARSGLYDREHPGTPLWSVDWYARNVELTADGRYLVRLGEDPAAPSDPGVAFYDAGRELARWPVARLVAGLDGVTSTGVHWFRSGHLDAATLAYTLETIAGDVHVFDLRTGALVSSRREPPPPWSALLTLSEGRVEALQAFRACGAGADLPLTADGRRVARDGHGILFRLDDTGPGGATVRRVSGVPFPAIDTARNLGAGTDGAPRWALALRSGRSLVVAADPALTRYCGRSADGAELELDAAGILAIDGLAPAPTTPAR